MLDQLQEQIKVVATVRQVSQRAIDIKKSRLTEWETENRELLDDISANATDLSEQEETLRELILQAYAETGNKAPAPGVGIRERTVLTYDNKVAFDWAKSHKMALKLDVPNFEKIVKADCPDFVKITTEPQATIATELKVE